MTQTLAHALRHRREDGRTVPTVWQSWENLGIRPRFGQVMMVAASPGGAKSALIAEYVRRLGLPSLYFSADTDTATMVQRTLAAVTGETLRDIEYALMSPGRSLYLNKLAAETKHIWYAWDASPSFQDFNDEVNAYAVVHGEWPAVIVMDNLKDLAPTQGGAEHENYDKSIQFLHELSRTTGSLVIVLHHTLGEYEDGDKPVPLSGLKGKVGKTPRLILTLYRGWNRRTVNVCVVKNTGGPADPKCGLETSFDYEATTMKWTEI